MTFSWEKGKPKNVFPQEKGKKSENERLVNVFELQKFPVARILLPEAI